MLTLGVDVGSRAIKVVALEEGRVLERRRADTTFDPAARLRELLHGLPDAPTVATGYGRALVVEARGARAVTEIQAHARGARHLFPEAQSVLDIGGQDTKAIALDGAGRVRKFEMNDRCAAGTGRFLEVMASGFQVPIERFGAFALRGAPGTVVSAMCTVFAETEATSLMARGARPEDIALALHATAVRRSLSMLARVSRATPLVFTGGVARNPCVVALLSAELGDAVLVPDQPEFVGALGAALAAASRPTVAGPHV